MIKHMIYSIALLFSGIFFTGCINDSKIINYTTNENGEVMIVYESGETEVIGTIDSIILADNYSVFPSIDGYYIINGIKSTIPLKTFTVNFEANNNELIEAQCVKWRDKITEPKTNKKGYTLDGWYNGDKKWNFENNTVESEIKLSAKWVPNSYKITLTEVTPIDCLPIVIKSGDIYELPRPNKNGTNFLGWSYNDNLIPLRSKFEYADDINLVAKYSTEFITINFDSDEGTNIAPIVYKNNTVLLTLPVLERAGYTFMGWSLDNEMIKLPYKLNNSNLYLKAIWSK